MKALINYNGFTKMVSVSNDREVYEEHVCTTGRDYYDHLKTNLNYRQQTYFNTAIQHKYLIFKRKEVLKIDNEDIAIFEFYEER